MVTIVKAGLVSPAGLNVDELVDKSMQTLIILYGAILEFSCSLFQTIVRPKRQYLLAIDAMAKRYGKTPIEILQPGGNYTEADADIFNMLCFSTGIDQELQTQKKAKRKSEAKAKLK